MTAFGVSDGLACSISATVPATTGAAWLVPLKLRYGMYGAVSAPGSRYSSHLSYIVLPGLLRE